MVCGELTLMAAMVAPMLLVNKAAAPDPIFRLVMYITRRRKTAHGYLAWEIRYRIRS